MNTSLNAPCRWQSDSTNAENEIREIFFQHWDKLKNHFIAMVNEINKWREKVIEDANKYADEQIRILVDDCNRQQLIIDEKREENLDTTRAYAGANSIDLFDELRKECRLLEFQMAQLESVSGTLTGHRVITVQEQIEKMKREKSEASKLENDKSQEKSITEQTSTKQNNRNADGDLSVNLVSSIPNETHTHSTIVKSSNDDSRSINDENHSKALVMNGDDPINKCPVCFMIFPLSMTQNHRSQHVNEHCTDD